MSDPKNIIAIHGAPRSGTSWLGQIFNSHPSVAYRYQPLFSYAFKDRLNGHSDLSEIEKFFADLALTDDDFVLQTQNESLASANPDFVKSALVSHLVYKEVRYHDVLPNLMAKLTHLKLVAIIRDPREVLQSWYAAPREFNPNWHFRDEWRNAPSKNLGKSEEFFGYSGWLRTALIFRDLKYRFPDRVTCQSYHELRASPLKSIATLFSFCGLTPDLQTEQFIKLSGSNDRSDDPYSVFRDHRRKPTYAQLDPKIEKEILDDIDKHELSGFLDPSYR